MAVALPNLNEMARDLDGKLFPLGIFKLLYRLKVQGPKSARLIILGIRKKYRHVRKYAGLSAFLYAELNESGRKLGIDWGELGWTLEDNGAGERRHPHDGREAVQEVPRVRQTAERRGVVRGAR